MNKQNGIRIIYEDNHLLVAEKPANMPVQADISRDLDLLTMLKDYLKIKYNKPGNVYLGLVHRLDRPVGGVMFSPEHPRLHQDCRSRSETGKLRKYTLQ